MLKKKRKKEHLMSKKGINQILTNLIKNVSLLELQYSMIKSDG